VTGRVAITSLTFVATHRCGRAPDLPFCCTVAAKFGRSTAQSHADLRVVGDQRAAGAAHGGRRVGG